MTPHPLPPPTSRDFWLGPTDLRPLGIFRILLGLVTCWDIFRRVPHLAAWHTDEGVLPRLALLQGIARPWRLSILDMMGTPGMVGTFFAIAFIAAVGLTLGYRARACNVVCWLYVVSATERNLGLTDSSDTLHRMLLFWMLFAPSGAAYSLDRALARDDEKSWPPHGSPVGLRFMQGQVMLLYLITSITKGGPSWLDGSAVYRALQVWDFARPTGTFFVEHLAFLARPLTWASLALELCVAPALLLGFWKLKARKTILVAGTCFHLGIESMMNVGMFSLMMPMTYALFLWPSACDVFDKKRPKLAGLVEWFRRTGQKLLPDPAHPNPARPPSTDVRRLVACWVFMGIIIGDQFHEVDNRRPRLPVPFIATMESLSLWQNWRMFAPNPVAESGPWSVVGTLSDGTKVDVLAVAAPDFAEPPSWRWYYSRWAKFRLHLASKDQRAYLPWFGRWLCARYEQQRDPAQPRLESYELIWHVKRAREPGAAENPVEPRTMLVEKCPR